MPHRAFIHFDMHVTDVQYGEAVERSRQLSEADLVVPDENTFSVPTPAPVETGQFQGSSNDRMDRIPVLNVKEVETLAKDLRFMVRLDS
jgi:hypothetical protein